MSGGGRQQLAGTPRLPKRLCGGQGEKACGCCVTGCGVGTGWWTGGGYGQGNCIGAALLLFAAAAGSSAPAQLLANVSVAVAAINEQAGDVSVLWSVGCAELVCVVIKPNLKLVVSWLAGEVGWFLPSVEDLDGWGRLWLQLWHGHGL